MGLRVRVLTRLYKGLYRVPIAGLLKGILGVNPIS